MMYRPITRSWKAGVLALALAAAGTIGAGAASAAAPSAATAPCATGYLCVQEISGTVLFVPDGTSEDFNPWITPVSITNLTPETYCVSGNASFGLPSGWTDDSPGTVFSVYPAGSPFGTCPA